MMRRMAVLGATGAVAMGMLSGCGASNTENSAQSSATYDAAPPPETVETDQSGAFEGQRSIIWGLEGSGGNSMRLQVQIGDPVTPEAVDTLGSSFSSLADVCTVDPERDMFIPIRVSAENTTDGFSIEPTVRITNPKTSNFEELETAADYNAGASCKTQEVSTDPWLGIGFSLESDEQSEKDFLAVLHGYRSPASPEGNPEPFNRAFGQVQVTEGTDILDRYEPTCIDTDAANVWTGNWNGLIQAHFSVLGSASDVGEADEQLPGC